MYDIDPKALHEGVSERVLLVVVVLAGSKTESSELSEMSRLVVSAGGVVAGHTTQRRNRPDSGFFVGAGKALELASLAESLSLNTIVLNHDLSPGQVRRLESTTGCKVVDRTELILSIFAVHARTLQARLRIELAQIRYMLPRLSGMWHHLDRLGAGIGTRGPGETQLEVDRRRARARMSSIEKKLGAIDAGSELRHRRRRKMFSVALAGYTNAGKSTLMNRLCEAGVHTEDKFFATLDATSRRLELPDGGAVILSDTVGFIDRLPESLLASFRSTLSVVCDADLILLVADASDTNRQAKVDTVVATLDRIGAGTVDRVVVWNKCDLPVIATPGGLDVSAVTGEGIDSLLAFVQKKRREVLEWCRLEIDVCTGDLEHWLRSNSIVDSLTRDPYTGSVEVVCGLYRGVAQLRRKLRATASRWNIRQFSPDGKTDRGDESARI